MIEDRLPTLWRVEEGDAIDGMRRLPPARFQVCITSPPYFALRDYEVEPRDWDEITYTLPGGDVTIPAMSSCLGLEEAPLQYIGHLVEVFREVRRVLRDDGVIWVVIGDSYKRGTAGSRKGNFGRAARGIGIPDIARDTRARTPGAKDKDLLGIPWLLAFALRDDGWYLRSDVIWAKTNPMPGSQRDRCTSSHEYVFMLAKQERYFYDDIPIREPFADARMGRDGGKTLSKRNVGGRTDGFTTPGGIDPSANGGRTKRDVWQLPEEMWGQFLRWLEEHDPGMTDIWRLSNKPFPAAHFAVFPPELVEPMILASTSAKACSECGAQWRRLTDRLKLPDRPNRVQGRDGDSLDLAHGSDGRTGNRHSIATITTGFEPTCEHGDDEARCMVLDPFAGAGTTGKVAVSLGRDFLGFELSPKYVEMARDRIRQTAPINSAPDPHGVLLAG